MQKPFYKKNEIIKYTEGNKIHKLIITAVEEDSIHFCIFETQYAYYKEMRESLQNREKLRLSLAEAKASWNDRYVHDSYYHNANYNQYWAKLNE